MALAPGEANFLNTLAFVLRQCGKLDEARDAYERSSALAAAKSPVRVRALYGLALTRRDSRDTGAAAESARQALAEEGDSKVFNPQGRAGCRGWRAQKAPRSGHRRDRR